MARSKAVLGEGARLTDYLSTTLLASVFPAPQVQEVLAEQGVASQRVRSFPAPAVAYYCMALSLYPEAAYESVFAAVTEGLAWRDGAPTPPTVAKSAISQARKRLGWEPMKQLMRRCCQPLAQASSNPQSFYHGLRLMAIDGSNFEICDEALNSEHFGRPGSLHYRNSNGVLDKVKVHAEERLRAHLMKRHRVRDRRIGLGRFPSQLLYEKHGLYKVPTVAGWKTAHALV